MKTGARGARSFNLFRLSDEDRFRQKGNVRVRLLPLQPSIRAFRQAPEETRE